MKQWFRRRLATYYYLRRPIREFLPAVLLLVALTVAGGWSLFVLQDPEPGEQRLTFARALYVTYCMIFMEHLINRFPDHPLLEFFFVVLPPIGLVVILDGFTRFGFHVLRRDETGGEWMRALTRTYKNHVVLVGLGKVGLRVLEQLLRLREEVIVLDKDASNPNLAVAQQHGVPYLIGSSRQVGILNDLNIAAAKSVIAATDDDLANLELALDARKINPAVRVVLRMFDQELAGKVRDAFDIHLAFSTSALAAPLLATASSDRYIVNSFYVGDQLLVVARLTINAGSKLVGKKIRDLGSEYKAFILAHTRGAVETHFPQAELDFQPGDTIVVQTEPATLKLLHRWNGDD